MSREALSLDISRLVSRVVSGEAIDTAERGAALAAKYPDLGMSGVLIGQAIERAAGMVGMIKSAPPPPKPVFVPAPAPIAAPAPTASNGNGHKLAEKPSQTPAAPTTTLPVAAQSIDDELAAAIDAEIGNLVSDHTAAAAAPANARNEAPRAPARNETPRAPASAPRPDTAAQAPEAHGSLLSKGPVGIFRRALFGG